MVNNSDKSKVFKLKNWSKLSKKLVQKKLVQKIGPKNWTQKLVPKIGLKICQIFNKKSIGTKVTQKLKNSKKA
jgi:hypothetical protein